jgi:hypothetical protein
MMRKHKCCLEVILGLKKDKSSKACDLLKKLDQCMKGDQKKVEVCINLEMVDALKDMSPCRPCFTAIIDVAKSAVLSKAYPVGFIDAIIGLIAVTSKGDCKCLDGCKSG